jgi:c-di-GMP-binding flagellar brake protein YcgR
MPLDALGGSPGSLDEFRISGPREVLAMLRQLMDGSVELYLNAANGNVVHATIWTLDADRGNLGLSVDANDTNLQAMLESQEVVVVGYLDSVKLQFDANNLVLVRGERSSVLSCALPRELFRFQRRSAYRVRPVMRSSPMARVRHTEIADMQLALRVLDVSIGGCALFLPDDVPPMQPGVVLNQVQIELDADTRFHVNLRLQHVTSLNSDSRGVRLGCEFVRADSNALRSLQRFIDQTQKRGRLLSIG